MASSRRSLKRTATLDLEDEGGVSPSRSKKYFMKNSKNEKNEKKMEKNEKNWKIEFFGFFGFCFFWEKKMRVSLGVI